MGAQPAGGLETHPAEERSGLATVSRIGEVGQSNGDGPEVFAVHEKFRRRRDVGTGAFEGEEGDERLGFKTELERGALRDAGADANGFVRERGGDGAEAFAILGGG